MDMRELELLVPTLFGLEGLCAEELRRLKLPEVAAENGRVRCKAAPADIPRVNLNLRTGERVLLVVGRYRAADFEALFEGCRALPWEEFIPREGAFPVKGHSLNSQLHAVPACQAVLKKAAAARLGEKYGLETLPESGALYQIQFSIMRDEVTLMLDTTGVGLHKRGYRAVGWPPPCGRRWPPPWCSSPATGGGTLLRPSAARAPSPSRRPSSPKTGRRASTGPFPPRSGVGWTAGCGSRPPARPWTASMTGHTTSGAGTSTQAVAIARANAEKADVEDVVRFEVADAAAFRRDAPYGRVVTNPPYGERILEKREAEELYRAFGRAVRTLPEGWRVSVLSSHTEFERTFGRAADKKRKLYNGMLKCDLFQYGR